MKRFLTTLILTAILLTSASKLVSASPFASTRFDQEICIIDDQAGVEFHIREPEPGLATLRITGAPYYQDYPADGTITHNGCLSFGTASYETQQVGGTITLHYTIDHCFHRASVRVEYLGQHFYYQDNDLHDSVCSGSPLPTNQPPVVEAGASMREGIAPLTLYFTGEASDPDGRIILTRWDFGDGHSSTELSLPHTYIKPGTYAAKFTAMDELGLESTATLEIIVRGPVVIDPPPNQPPSLSIDASTFSVKPKNKEAITFTARAEDEDGEIAEYLWDFGDGTSSSGATVQKGWRKKGQYTVTCRVKDDDGAEASASLTISVRKK